ncbi:MAG: leucine-rich repeat domain-containing protein [Bacteroidales bacterium]|nr:leucine-rich repeat domain-containing protein [Bacteroidales bacterium]
MTTNDLHQKIKEAYATPNLNRITVTLIGLYKDEQFGTLKQIAEMISESVDIVIDDEGRFFSKLMMLYHPDRGDFHRNEIDRLAANDDHDSLLGYAHILMLGRIEEIAITLSSYEDIDYSPVYEWDVNLEGFTVVNSRETEPAEHQREKTNHKKRYSFYDAVKIRMYGNTAVEFPPHYLEDTDEFELSQSGINDLDGVQYCIHALVMDLSGNAISDISLLWGLKHLEELDLSDNRIEELETLINLHHLKNLNLSNNPVKDISSLFGMSKLEYVDLTNTKVPGSQLQELEEAGVVVVK